LCKFTSPSVLYILFWNSDSQIKSIGQVAYKFTITSTGRQILFTENNKRRMAIANGTWVSLCNQPKTHFGLPRYALGRQSR